MRERLLKYIDYIDHASNRTLSSEERSLLLNDLLIQIQFFQHERLIHLIVTTVFAILALIAFLGNYFLNSILLSVFVIGMLIMLLFYVRHYFLLERGVQKLYHYYDRLHTNANH